jgi:hypothetical protein
MFLLQVYSQRGWRLEPRSSDREDALSVGDDLLRERAEANCRQVNPPIQPKTGHLVEKLGSSIGGESDLTFSSERLLKLEDRRLKGPVGRPDDCCFSGHCLIGRRSVLFGDFDIADQASRHTCGPAHPYTLGRRSGGAAVPEPPTP